jgi:UDP-N-acetyl-D-mannosaminuronate dehydrogenase
MVILNGNRKSNNQNELYFKVVKRINQSQQNPTAEAMKVIRMDTERVRVALVQNLVCACFLMAVQCSITI